MARMGIFLACTFIVTAGLLGCARSHETYSQTYGIERDRGRELDANAPALSQSEEYRIYTYDHPWHPIPPNQR